MLTAQRAHNPECRKRIGKLRETDDKGSARLEGHSLRRKKRRQGDAEAEATEEQAGGAAQATTLGNPRGTSPKTETQIWMEGEAADPATPCQQQADSGAAMRDVRGAASSTKRSAETLEESLKRDTANDHAGSDIRIVLPAAAAEADAAGAPATSQSGGAQSSGGAGPPVPGARTMSDVGSLGGVDDGSGSVLLGKARAFERTKSAVTDIYRAREVDITAAEIASVSTVLLQLGSVDVVEVFSPPCFTDAAPSLGLKPGFAVDLATGWNLQNKSDKEAFFQKLEQDDPYL